MSEDDQGDLIYRVQQRVQDLWATTQHAGKNATDVARLIARDTDGNANTIRRKIKKLS